MRIATLWLGCSLVLISACTAGRADRAAVQPAAEAILRDVQGRQIGTASFWRETEGVRLDLRIAGLPPGEHGVHVHEHGVCEAPAFTSAGGHLNPVGNNHGLASATPHAGDLPNLLADAEGNTVYSTVTPRVTLATGEPTSLLRPGGTALVVHAGPDDQITDPSGASGARIACGVIVPAAGL